MSNKRLLISISAAALSIASGLNIVAAAEPSDSHSATVGTAVNDAAITAKVKSAFLGDARLKDADISVRTANGVVTLTGSAPNPEVKKAAGDIAKSVEGVGNIDNDIHAPSIAGKIERKTKHAAEKTEAVVSDSWITTKVKSALLADSITKGFKISVKTVNHVVTLSGTVNSEDSAEHATQLAKQVKGVENVDSSNLKFNIN